MSPQLYERQSTGLPGFDTNNNMNDPSDGYYDDWWWSPAGMAVRYAIITLIFALLVGYFLGGYLHAKRRVSKGLPPLAYHRWMVNRRTSRYAAPSQQWYSQPYYQNGGNQGYNAGSYGMQGFAPPPPAYEGHVAPPPVYQPPQGGSKVAADQNYVPVQRAGESSGGDAPRL
nr:hypothetical protein B0A51_18464 [Rachicladosporium sp. CCFEE 5018]